VAAYIYVLHAHALLHSVCVNVWLQVIVGVCSESEILTAGSVHDAEDTNVGC